MRIGIDARELCGRPTGVGRYLGHLLQEWEHLDAAVRHEFTLYSPHPVQAPSGFRQRQIVGAGGTWWEQTALARSANQDALDVFFAPGYSAPLRLRAPTVVAIHDLSFVYRPEWFRRRERWRRRLVTRLSARQSRLVVTFSAFVARQLADTYRIPDGHIEVIPHGVHRFASHDSSGRREPLVLFAGSVFNRRHVPTLMRAFAQVATRHEDARLAVVGENRTFPHKDLPAEARRLGISNRVVLSSYVDDRTLGDFYGRARVFAFLSEYEGFGLPPLEALAAGIPALVAETPVAREVYGNAVRYVSHNDLDGIAHALEEMLYESSSRTEEHDRSVRHLLERYSWAHSARATLEALERVGS